jgi:hypothetical protein
MNVLSIWDLIFPPLYIMLIVVICIFVRNKHIATNPAYHYYLPGLLAKIAGAIAMCLVYTLYYSGGDATGYYLQAESVNNLFYKDVFYYFEVLFKGPTPENHSYFDEATGYIDFHTYMTDKGSMYITRFVSVLCFFTNGFVATTILLSVLCYDGVWRLYLLFCDYFPKIRKQLAISILFIPSVVFWGSGLLKDTITLAAVGWYAYGFHRMFIAKRYTVGNIAAMFVSGFLLIALKPYILFALLPGSLIWLSYDKISKTKNKAIRTIIAPILIAAGIGGGFYLLSSMGSMLGVYAIENVLDRAVVVQRDLKSSYYGGNSFDIGEFDASIGSVLAKSPLAINAALFRPYLWEVRNPLMFLTALESTYIFLLTFGLLVRLKFVGFFRFIWANPLLLFSVLFSLFFAFSVGLSTPNFGALSRLKIPCIPFFVASLFVLRHLYETKSKKRFRF